MKYFVNVSSTKLTFSRKLILCRDNYTCCYCKKKCTNKTLTIDHIIPKSKGGINSFTNCITACLECNRKKANKTLDQLGLKLQVNPEVPTKYLSYLPSNIEWHNDWLFFVTY